MSAVLNGRGVQFHHVLDIKCRHILGFLFLVACFFPWVGPIKLGTDTQPYALLFGTALCLTMAMGGRIPTLFAWYGIPVVAALAYLILANFSFPAVRGAAGYFSLAVLSIASYFFYKKNRDSSRFFFGVLWVYLLAGLIQLYIDPDFFHFLLSRESGYATIGGRGVESLASEPTFLGIHLLIIGLYCWVSPDLKARDRYRIALLALIGAVFISRSSTVLLFLCLLGVAHIHRLLPFLTTHRVVLGLILIVTTVLLVSDVSDSISDLRFVELVALLWESPEVVIRVDESVNSRIFEIVFSFLGFLDQPLSGHGFDSWTSYVLEKSREFPLANFAPGDTGRITSFFGSLLFELGLAAAPLFYFIFRATCIYQKTSKVSVWFQLVFLGMLLFQSVPVTYPLVPLYIGRAFALLRRRDLHFPPAHLAPKGLPTF
jgi:hypothetical protein